MSVLAWFQRGVGEMMVARPDDAKSQVVWKHPDPTIPLGSQLTVEADEVAVFFRDGKPLSQGTKLVQKDLADTLSRLAENGYGCTVEAGPKR